MNLEQYFEESEGAFPERGVVGIESEWLEAGNLAVPFGELWAGDLYVMERGGGTVLTVPKGSHRVQVKGMDFKGHRRSSRVRVALATTTEPQITKRFGSTSTDCGMIGVYDVAAFERIVLRSHAQEYKRDLVSAAMRQGMGCASFMYAGKTFELAFLPSGLGDGSFGVYSVEAKGKTVGLEVEFLAPGFKVTG